MDFYYRVYEYLGTELPRNSTVHSSPRTELLHGVVVAVVVVVGGYFVLLTRTLGRPACVVEITPLN